MTMIGAYLIFWPMHYIGMAGVPRRYYRFDTFDAFSHFDGLNQFITIAAIITFGAQLLFVFNIFYSMFRGKKMVTQNPWGATTLEWTTPVEPIHGNWPGKLPVVHRWAYDYSNAGSDRDFIPQHVPKTEEEKQAEAQHH
jgi:cytochrome c oxidase subunit 1